MGLAAWYKRASEYGESYSRPFCWLVGILLGFALLYPLAGLRFGPGKLPLVQNVQSSAQASDRLTYWRPFLPAQPSNNRHKAQWGLFGNSCITALYVAAFQKDLVYEPSYPWGRVLALVEVVLTSTLIALFLLAVRRQFRR
jgi:hypothetical protein